MVGVGGERWAWSVTVAGAVQTFALRYALEGPTSLPKIDRFLESLPPPRDVPESLLLAGLAGRLRDRCAAITRAEFARRAASYLCAHYSAALSIAAVARAAACGRRSLQRFFRQEFDLTLREFHARVRVREALTIIAAGEKNSVAASAAVTEATKTSAAPCAGITGISLSDVRRLDPDQLHPLIASIRPEGPPSAGSQPLL